MKKYRYLVLLIVCFSSLLGLLIYRNEYNKLRSTFEILNFFSAPVDSIDCLTLNETTLKDYTYRNFFSKPSPVWVRVEEFHVYSAFWQTKEQKHFARALGVGPVTRKTVFECHVWFDHQDVLISGNGKFSSSVLYTNNTLALYEFICEVDISGLKGEPYSFVLIKKSIGDVQKIFIPIFLRRFEHVSSIRNNFGLCVRPDRTGFSKTELVEFIGFHQIIGLSDLIVYENGIHHGILSKLKKLESLNSFIRSLSVLQWNFPYDNPYIEAKFLEEDCLSRTADILNVVSILEWNQYIIPKQDKFLRGILPIFNEKKPAKFKMNTQTCCINTKNDKRSEKSWPLVLRKTRCIISPEKSVLVFNPTVNGFEKDTVIQPSNGIVNIYQNCHEVNPTLEYDISPHRFIIDLMSNRIIKLWKSGGLFTHVS